MGSAGDEVRARREQPVPESLWPVVLRVADGAVWPPGDAVSAERFFDVAHREGLIPILYAQEAALPEMVRAVMQRRRAILRLYESRDRAHVALARTTTEILRGHRVIFLKGTDYRYRLYADPHFRPMADVDVLVPMEEMRAAVEKFGRVAASVFPAGDVSRVRGYGERAFEFEQGLVEVHDRFIQTVRHRIDYEEVFRQRIRLASSEIDGERLSDVHALVYHCLSMAGVDQLYVPLPRAIDLWLMLRANPEALLPAVQVARDWKAARSVWAALRFGVLLFPELDTPLVTEALNTLVSRRAASFLERFVMRSVERSFSRREQLWRKFWLIDEPWRRAMFASYHTYALVAGRILRLVGHP